MGPVTSKMRLPDLGSGSLTDSLLRSLRGRAEQVVLSDGHSGGRLTGAQLSQQILRLAGGLQAAGLRPGQMVALIAPNSPQWCVALHGVLALGCAVTPVNPAYTGPEMARQLRAAGAVAALVQQDLSVNLPSGLKVLRFAADLEAWMGEPIAAPRATLNDLALMPFSSGTTGVPKGVPLTHANLLANLAASMAMLELAPGEATLGFLPFFHIYGLATVLNAYLIKGGHVVTLPRFDPGRAADLIAAHGMRQLFVVPPAASLLLAHPAVQQADLSSLRYILSAAAPLGDTLRQQLHQRFDCTVCEGFGMTELSSFSHMATRHNPTPGSCGQLMAGLSARIVDPGSGCDLGPDQVGELWLKGPQVMAGYHRDIPASAAAFAEPGWLRSGDLARIDAAGNLYLCGRLKDILKIRGFQVSPAEVESAMMAFPGVAEAALSAVPSGRGDAHLVAFVVPAGEPPPCRRALFAHLAQRLASYKLPRRILLSVQIPKSPAGKIDRAQLQQLARDHIKSV